MSAYDKLAEATKAVVDRQAERLVHTHGMTLAEAREFIASRVKSVTVNPSSGTGH